MSNIEHRKLAAIMFTDMVDYSAMAQRDDKLAQELLEEHRRLLREIFPRRLPSRVPERIESGPVRHRNPTHAGKAQSRRDGPATD